MAKKTKEEKHQERLEKKQRQLELQKEKAEKRAKSKEKAKEDKAAEFRAKSRNTWKTIIAVLLWVMIFFFAARGIIGVIRMEDSDSVRKTLNETNDMIKQERVMELTTTAFAKNFVVEYFTYDNDRTQDWFDSMKYYIANGVSLSEPSGEKQTVVSAEISGYNVVDKNNVDVLVSALVQYDKEASDGMNEKKIVSQQTPYLVEVPIRIKGENIAVIGPPLVKASNNNAGRVSSKIDIPNTSDIDETDRTKAEIAVTTFLKQYYGGTATELKYLVTDNFHSHKTVKALKYSNVNVTDVGKVRGGYKVKANVELINGMTTVAETCYITLKTDGGMLKVDSISTR